MCDKDNIAHPDIFCRHYAEIRLVLLAPNGQYVVTERSWCQSGAQVKKLCVFLKAFLNAALGFALKEGELLCCHANACSVYKQTWQVSINFNLWPIVNKQLMPTFRLVLQWCAAVSLTPPDASGAVDWGTAIQAERSRVRFLTGTLKFFIDLILPVGHTVGLGWTQPLTEISNWDLPLGVKAAGA